MEHGDHPGETEAGVTHCYRHPDREAGVRCQRCERHICPECMISASVGFQCPECVKAQSTRVYTARSLVSRPIVTQVLIGINAVVFLLVASNVDLFLDLGLFGPAVAESNEWWRIVTSGFVHARDNPLHILFNMYLLWMLGRMLETVTGPARFGALYLASMLGGSLGVLLLSPSSFTVGASGGVFGLMGAAALAYRARGIDIWASGLGGLIAINLVITFVIPGISIGGHVGGLMAGLAAGYLLFETGEDPRTSNRTLAAIAVFALALALGAIWAASTWMNPVFGTSV